MRSYTFLCVELGRIIIKLLSTLKLPVPPVNWQTGHRAQHFWKTQLRWEGKIRSCMFNDQLLTWGL